MPRIARVVVPNIPHHVVQRGVRRMEVFFSDQDKEHYLASLAESASKHGLEFLAWCLMSNHVHFVVVPNQERSLAATFGEAHRKYTRAINLREGWRGHLWQERFHSYPLDESHLLAAVRYVELNPVRASLVSDADEWSWSSARFHLGMKLKDDLVRDRALYDYVGDWRSYLGKEEESLGMGIESHLKTGRPLGPVRFLKKVEQRLNRSLVPRRGGWPKGKKRK